MIGWLNICQSNDKPSNKMKDYKGKNKKDLLSMVQEKRTALRNFHFGIAGSKVRNVKEGKNIKKDIARLLTEYSKAQ